MSQNNKFKFLCRLTFLSISLLIHLSPAFAERGLGSDQDFNDFSQCYAGGDGHDVPTPFEEYYNQRFEFADGEVYALAGKVVIGSSLFDGRLNEYYLKIDLDQHPWLARGKRQVSPSYPLEGSINWLSWDRQPWKLVRAVGRVIVDGSGMTRYVVFLKPLTK